ncbi:DUF2523 family protein [Pseudoxanthomonas winnipegensis]|uniref:DUF2523 family protein n=1 Tax=Pseudoxanthomonas winnipegensis TaxID=2480810 RepID=UPI00102D9248|nr:DUF2523 family protein [Pseudoxanthomonas winnipegensis]TAA08851.1 DUF2523 domain-containing protein [Pseudoxanthomonas winnipegensis]TAH71795.1 DUF2523 domain-containing protein [Pseudoxanthomonas winnipegensis]
MIPLLVRIGQFLLRIGPLLARLWVWLKASKWAKWLLFYVFSYMGGIIGLVMKWLGISFAVSEWVMPHLTPLISEYLLGLPPDWAAFVGLTKIDVAITIVLSAAAVKASDQIQVKRRRDSWQTPL